MDSGFRSRLKAAAPLRRKDGGEILELLFDNTPRTADFLRALAVAPFDDKYLLY